MAESIKFPFGPYDLLKYTAETTQAQYVYSETKNSWIFSSEQVSGGRVTVSKLPPVGDPFIGDIWIKETDYSMYVWNEDEIAPGRTVGNWIGLTNMGLTASVYVGDDPPIYTQSGALWYNSATGDLKVRYDHINIEGNQESVWVAITGNGLVDFSNETASNIEDMQVILSSIERRMIDLEGKGFLTL